MSKTVHDANGKVLEYWDDRNMRYIDYRSEPPASRGYTTEEIIAAQERNILEDSNRNAGVIFEEIKTQINSIKTLIGSTTDAAGTGTMRAIKNQTNNTINQSPAAYVKAVNQNCIDLAQAVVRLSKLMTETLGDASSANNSPRA